MTRPCARFEKMLRKSWQGKGKTEPERKCWPFRGPRVMDRKALTRVWRVSAPATCLSRFFQHHRIWDTDYLCRIHAFLWIILQKSEERVLFTNTLFSQAFRGFADFIMGLFPAPLHVQCVDMSDSGFQRSRFLYCMPATAREFRRHCRRRFFSYLPAGSAVGASKPESIMKIVCCR